MMQDYSGEYDWIRAKDKTDFEIAWKLFTEYARSLDFDLCFQDFQKELKELDTLYREPAGGLILMKEISSGEFAGCAGIRKLEERVAELKRMYIREHHRGKGLGQQLLDHALGLARELKYEKIRLDTLGSMKAAIHLYRKNGFNHIEPYRHNPVKNALFLELIL
jgi:ribosomal protein S18 acetylase RimI-like enzyme